jgi:hypothetical protein
MTSGKNKPAGRLSGRPLFYVIFPLFVACRQRRVDYQRDPTLFYPANA